MFQLEPKQNYYPHKLWTRLSPAIMQDVPDTEHETKDISQHHTALSVMLYKPGTRREALLDSCIDASLDSLIGTDEFKRFWGMSIWKVVPSSTSPSPAHKSTFNPTLHWEGRCSNCSNWSWVYNSTGHSRSTSNPFLVELPKSRITLLTFILSFFFFPRLWNKLPHNLQSHFPLQVFKTDVHDHLSSSLIHNHDFFYPH